MPETNEGMEFDEMGICKACQSAEQKIHINWKERESQLRKIFEEYKQKSGDNYDCIIGVSGGKDSTFQLHVLTKVYEMNPLVVTFNHRWYNETGRQNLQNLIEKFNVDHLMFTPREDVVNKLAKKSLSAIGDVCWHCHAGVGAFVLQTAIRYNIPLIVWGESVSHASGRSTHLQPVKYDRNYFLKTSSKVPAIQMLGDGITKKQISPYNLPSQEECDRVGIVGIFLSDYIFWDDERQTEFVRDVYGWKEHEAEGTYKFYKSAGCKMVGLHDYTKFVKRGFGRGTDHACQDVRAGLLTREEGFELAKKYDTERPEILDYYLQITGYTEDEFYEILKKKREGKAKELP
jgi:N-acetyl sugar amidotransferase